MLRIIWKSQASDRVRRTFFELYGKVTKVRLLPAKACALVTFSAHSEAEALLAATSGTVELEGTDVRVTWAKPKVPSTSQSAALPVVPTPQMQVPVAPFVPPPPPGIGTMRYASQNPARLGSVRSMAV